MKDNLAIGDGAGDTKLLLLRRQARKWGRWLLLLLLLLVLVVAMNSRWQDAVDHATVARAANDGADPLMDGRGIRLAGGGRRRDRHDGLRATLFRLMARERDKTNSKRKVF